MNGTTKQFTITPHKRQTRPSLAARLHHNQLLQQEQKEEYGASGTTQVLGAASKRRRATMAPEPVRQGNPIKVLLPRLEQLAQCMSTLEQNFKHLEGIDKALSSFNDAFSTFLQGMAMNAQCIVFPEAPSQLSFTLWQEQRYITDTNAILREPGVLPLGTAQSEVQLESRSVMDLSYAHETPTMTQHMDTEAAEASHISEQPPAAVRKRKLPPKKFPMKKLIENLPLRYRENPHREYIELIVKALRREPDGLYIHQIVKETGAPKHRCAEYMNALVHSKDVLKIARKGILYQLDPIKYPPLKKKR